jgi:hypothetical protein
VLKCFAWNEDKSKCEHEEVIDVDVERKVVVVEDLLLEKVEYPVTQVLVENEDGYDLYVNHPERRTVARARRTHPLPNPTEIADIVWPQILDVAHSRIRGDFFDAFKRGEKNAGDVSFSLIPPHFIAQSDVVF